MKNYMVRTWQGGEYVAIPDLQRLTETAKAADARTGKYDRVPMARVRSTVPCALAPSTWTSIPFDTAESNTGAWLAGSPLVVPAGFAGVWKIGAAVDIERASCNKALRLAINASRYVALKYRNGVGDDIPGRMTLRTHVRLDVGDFVEVEAWHDYPSPLNSVPMSYAPVLWGRWVGRGD